MTSTVALNVINQILEIDQDVFTKDEIIALLKRDDKKEAVIESQGVVLNPEKFHVTFNGVNHVLARKEFQLLYYLMSNKNRVMRRNDIMSDIWGDDVIVTDRTIDVHIRKIRMLGIPYVMTRKGIGYLWEEK